jgi:hypothetical protein
MVRNLSTIGRKKVRAVTKVVDPECVFPLIRGRDVKKWAANPSSHIIVPHDSATGEPVASAGIKTRLSQTYDFLVDFQSDLEDRSFHKLWGKRNPFYAVYDIGGYSFAPFKVA